MEAERNALIRHMMALERGLYDYLLEARVPAWAEVDLTMPQLKVLYLVGGPNPLPTSQVARSLAMTLSTATGVVDRLVAQGLVKRLENPLDRRVVLLTATEEGRAVLDKLLSAGLGHLQDILERLSSEQLRIVASAVDLLYEAAIGLPARHPSVTGDAATSEMVATSE